MSQGDVWPVPAACGYHRVEPEAGEFHLVQTCHWA